ncbi:hypothetical protein LCGC14_1595310 [marine sediment metagenome]|uniref:ParB-like N-terminal domain-containing protein n=1 Tax=marine sediment metagenome TaxID=412755 RepID=A0A0F9KTG6_9ZZZZ
MKKPKTKIKPRATIGKVPVWCAHDKIVPCVELIMNPKNPNTHPVKQIEKLSHIISKQGWRLPITVSNRSGLIVRGHGRLEAAFKAGINKAPVDYQDYESEALEHADLVADNYIAELAVRDNDKLSELLSELKVLDIDMELTAYDLNEIDEITNPNMVDPPGSRNDGPKEVECPQCGEIFIPSKGAAI